MKKQESFYYEARLPEVGAEIAIEFFPDCNMMNIHFIKDGKKHVLPMMNYDPEHSSFCEIDNKTWMSLYNYSFCCCSSKSFFLSWTKMIVLR